MYIFVHTNTSVKDLTLLFADNNGKFDTNDVFVEINDNQCLEDLVVIMGKFRSKTEARKNKWSGDLPLGYSEHKISKTSFCVFLPIGYRREWFSSDEEFTEWLLENPWCTPKILKRLTKPSDDVLNFEWRKYNENLD